MKFSELRLVAVLTYPLVVAAAPQSGGLDSQFQTTVKPFVNKYCVGCHGGKAPAAQLDLRAYTNVESVAKDYPRWALVRERLELKDMPPKPMKATPDEESGAVVHWIEAMRAEQIKKYAGDPGLVTVRRLSNAEYNYTIRDLTGADMQVTREFPIDPANPAGFDNSGESLTMSPALLNKYLQAAREVANHMVLKPDTIDFAGHPMLVETDREKYGVQRIVKFYFSQPTAYADYFEAAWRYKYRAALGKPAATLLSIAKEQKISPKYLPLVWQILNEPGALGPVLKLQTMFKALPKPQEKKTEEVAAQCKAMDVFVKRIRFDTAMQFSAPRVKGLPPASQPLLNWKLKQFATHRRESDPVALRNDTDAPMVAPEIPRYAGLHQEAAGRWAALVNKSRSTDMDLVVPAKQRKRYEAAFARFAKVFPDQFFVSERGRFFPDDSQDKGRLLSAGYHSVLGFYRDDLPLVELILDEKGKAELDRLWNEFDYMAQATERTWVQYFFNQSGEVQGKGAESSSDRPVNHKITDTEVILAMRDAYLKKAAADAANDPAAPKAIEEHYTKIDATLRGLEKQKDAAATKHMEALVKFAGKAYRRPLRLGERASLLEHYNTLRAKNELSHEDALRECIVSVLMAPDYLYRFAESPAAPVVVSKTAKPATRAIDGVGLANRLSYFLWSSMPDEELLRVAATGTLQRPDVLLAQARRMMKDARLRGMATEFTGNWLQFRNFEKNNSVDRMRFPEFTNELRSAMFEEPVRLIADAIATNRPALDLLYGKYTFVNATLAKFYGMPEVKDGWVKVEEADRYGRGGLLPMAVFLTQNSPGLRTSPVKRGNWVVQRVLGEIVPPPPPVVPELPNDEAAMELPVREALAKHRENALCAACHQRIDSFGLAFEGYGPVGNVRAKDLAGRAVETEVTYPGGSKRNGVDGLKEFIRERRQKEFVTNLSRKLLAFALNRSLQLSDEELVERMVQRASASGFRMQTFLETIITSPQFMRQRVSQERESE